MKRRLLLALPVAVGAIAAWAAMTLSAVSAGPLDWPLAPATPVTKIYSDTFTPLSGAPDGQGIQNHRYMANPVAAPNYFMPAGGYGHVVLVNSPDLSIGAVPMSAVSAEVCVELELNSTVRNEWARLYFGVQDKDQNVVHWTDPKTDEPFLILATEDSQQCHTLAFPRPVKLVNHPHLVVAVELMLDSGSGAVLDGVTYTLQPTLGGDLTPTDEWQWPYVVGATIYPGTIQRAYPTYPCYTLAYSDAFQTYTVYLPANEITYAEGGTPLPNPIPNPVAVDYVGPIDNYHYTLDFRYQGVSYTAPWSTSCPQKNPYVWGDANHCNLPLMDRFFGTVYIYSWDIAKNDWAKTPADGVLVRVYVKDCDPPCGTGEIREVGYPGTHSGTDGKWSMTLGQVGQEGYATYSLSGYPQNQDDLDYTFACIED